MIISAQAHFAGAYGPNGNVTWLGPHRSSVCKPYKLTLAEAMAAVISWAEVHISPGVIIVFVFYGKK